MPLRVLYLVLGSQLCLSLEPPKIPTELKKELKPNLDCRKRWVPIFAKSKDQAPRAWLSNYFFSEDEVDDLLDQIESGDDGKHTFDQRVMRNETKGTAVETNLAKTSAGGYKNTKLGERLELRFAACTRIQAHDGERVVRVLQQSGELQWLVHHDLNGNDEALARVATFIVYLNNVPAELGGHTVFPLVGLDSSALATAVPELTVLVEEGKHMNDTSLAADEGSEIYRLSHAMCERCRKGSKEPGCISPRKGAALMFYNRRLNGTPDPMAWHMGCPLVEQNGTSENTGARKRKKTIPTKWTAQKFKAASPRFWDTLAAIDEHWSAERGMKPGFHSPLMTNYAESFAEQLKKKTQGDPSEENARPAKGQQWSIPGTNGLSIEL